MKYFSMKKKQTIPLAALIFLSFCFAECHKNKTPASDNPYGLPNATQSGANTFAYRLNNVNFIANGKQSYPLLVGAQIISDTLFVGGSMSGNVSWTLLLQINRPLSQGEIYFIDNVNQSIKLISDSSCLGITYNITQKNAASGLIQLMKLDTSKKIVSGSFSCVIPIESCDSLRVTDGRFDIIYR